MSNFGNDDLVIAVIAFRTMVGSALPTHPAVAAGQLRLPYGNHVACPTRAAVAFRF
jgi:hypothetical protein